MDVKKVALGCLGVFVVVGLVGGILGYVYVIRPARAYITSFKQLGELADIDKTVTNKASFTAPDNGELTADQVARFVKVQESMESRLGARSAELKAKYDQLEKGQNDENRQPTFGEALGAIKDLTGIIVDAKKTQVDALNANGFSLDEYAWVREQVYAAAGMPFSEMDFQKLASSAQSGNREVPMTEVGGGGDVPEANKALVKPYADKLQQWVTLAFFGL